MSVALWQCVDEGGDKFFSVSCPSIHAGAMCQLMVSVLAIAAAPRQ